MRGELDRSLRQIETLCKTAISALTAAPIIFLLSVTFVRHTQISLPVLVEPVSSVSPASAANAKEIWSAEMLRPVLALSLLNLRRSAMNSSLANEIAFPFFAPSSSEDASQRAITTPGPELAKETVFKPATTSADVAPTESRASVSSSQVSPTDTTVPGPVESAAVEAASSADAHYDVAWPGQWLTGRTAMNQKQNSTAKAEKRRTLHIGLTPKGRKSSASSTKKDLGGPDQGDAPPI